MLSDVMTEGGSGGRTSEYTALKTEYVAWLLDPDRSPISQGAWAREHNIHPNTVTRWKSDDFVLGLLKRSAEMMEPVWARALANLTRIATQRLDDMVAVAAIKELGKLLKKYPNEKLDITTVNRVAYTQPDALALLSGEASGESIDPEALHPVIDVGFRVVT